MKLDFRMYIKFSSEEQLREQLGKLNVQAADGSKYSFLELCNNEEIRVYKSVTADFANGEFFIHDVNKALAYYTSVLGYLWGNIIRDLPEDVVMLSDIEDGAALELGDIIFYYLGGGGGNIGQFRLAGEDGNKLHSDCKINDFHSLLNSKLNELTEAQKAKLNAIPKQ